MNARKEISSKKFKDLCERFGGGMESVAKMKSGSDPAFCAFSNLGSSVGETNTSPGPTFRCVRGEGGRSKFKQSKINFPGSLRRRDTLLAKKFDQ